ncbi:MAG: hypothetical protein KC486_17750 [Myxococcales bacterium]|nr:hypothetical protein [Myxococcales bacterium]
MEANTAIYEGLKSFLDFGDADAENLKSLGPIMETHGKTLTDRFYEKLAGVPETARLIEGRVDALKQTHARWMSELFAGDYGEGYFHSRWKIGLTHVKVGVPPHYVEAVVSFLRVESEHVLSKELTGDDIANKHGSLTKILDLDLMIINLAYAFERVDRLCQFTGMSRKLIERCIEKG